MTLFRYVLSICPLFCALAQAPPPASRPATPVPPPPGSAQGVAPGSDFAPSTHQYEIQLPPPPPQLPPETVVLTVGDIQMNLAQFNVLADMLAEPMRSMAKSTQRKQFAQEVARVLVLAEEGRRRKLDQSGEFQLQNKFSFEELLARYAHDALNNDIHIDEATLRAYYEAHKTDYERVHVRQIVVRTQDSGLPMKAGSKDLTDQEALAKTRELIRRLKGGEDFGKIAAAESDEPGAPLNLGDIGWFSKGQMPPSIEEAAFQLTPHEIGEPVKTPAGYHILRVEEQQFKSFEETKAGIETKLRPDRLAKAMDDLVKNSKIDYNPAYFEPPKK